jgi:3-mercaptopyruvate sulfurtransferase SseA
MIKFLGLLIVLIVSVGCQQKPTKVIEESSNSIFKVKTVLVDTRDSFSYTSFHIPGSVNLVSTDFLILKDAKNKTRILDPDLVETVDRLARKGVSPDRKIILLATKKDSVENKKWRWLLKNLGFEDIQLNSVDEFNLQNKNARFSEPERSDIWTITLSEDLQKEFIIKRGKDCFVNYNEKVCGN